MSLYRQLVALGTRGCIAFVNPMTVSKARSKSYQNEIEHNLLQTY